MKNLIIPILLACLSVSFTVVPSGETNKDEAIPATVITLTNVPIINNVATVLYNEINLNQYGLSEAAFDYAWSGYQNLLKKHLVALPDYLTICDFSQSSKQKRFYLIDIADCKLLINTYVAHGRNSGGEYATRFSNKPSSLQTSLGFYITQNTYIGEHGLSLKIKGVDKGYNDKAGQRNIVIHGADYIDENWLQHSPYMGRSYGCPAVPRKESNTIVNTIKNGTCLFIYHPNSNYLLKSKILND